MRSLRILLIATTTFLCGLSQEGWALLTPPDIPVSAAQSGQDRGADMKTVQKALESKILQKRLREFGLSEKEVQARLDKLSDQQVHQLAQNVDAIAPGGDPTLVGILVVVLLVLLVVYLAKRV